MKTLNDILINCDILSVQGEMSLAIDQIVFDSRKAVNGSLFVAIKGTQVDGHSFISNVIQQGCTAILSEVQLDVPTGVTLVIVKDSSFALGIASSNFYDNPSSALKLVGVTGTNGKTTIVSLLHKVFSDLGYKVGLLSTVVNKIGAVEIPSTHTTPDQVSLNALLAQMVNEGCEFCFMEVSSHAVVQHRISGLSFTGGVFTNITHDHLDYHGSFKKYIKAIYFYRIR